MATMIKLELDDETADFEAVKQLPGLKDVDLDRDYGLVCIHPRKQLFVVRAAALKRLEERRQLSPEIVGGYGDVRISTTDRDQEE